MIFYDLKQFKIWTSKIKYRANINGAYYSFSIQESFDGSALYVAGYYISLSNFRLWKLTGKHKVV